MNTPARLFWSVVLVAIVFATAWFIRPAADTPLPKLPPLSRGEPEPVPAAVLPPQTESPNAGAPKPGRAAQPRAAEPASDPNELNERTLVGTAWERDGFRLEFGANGQLLIAGFPRAKWRVEGRRIRLYHDTTGEEHWLEIAGDKLLWQGQEIGRAP